MTESTYFYAKGKLVANRNFHQNEFIVMEDNTEPSRVMRNGEVRGKLLFKR